MGIGRGGERDVNEGRLRREIHVEEKNIFGLGSNRSKAVVTTGSRGGGVSLEP